MSSSVPEPPSQVVHNDIALAITGLRKSFGGAVALKGVDLEVRAGEIHGLLGHNGSGKSTLIKALAGYHNPDAGTVSFYGQPVHLPVSPTEARRLGFCFVHQDLSLIDTLPVVSNYQVTKLARRPRWWINWESEGRLAKDALSQYGLALRPDTLVGELSPVQKALLAIVRASQELRERQSAGLTPGMLILDEPTAFLPENETATLFEAVRDFAARGTSVLFVSHKLEEVLELTGRVTVLRDGEVVGTADTSRIDRADLVRMIVGHELPAQPSARAREVSHKASGRGLRAEGLTAGIAEDVSLAVSPSEILGLTGLVGAGYEDVLQALFGALPGVARRVVLNGAEHDLTGWSPAAAVRAGVALVPGDRVRSGGAPSLNVGANVGLQVLQRFSKWGRLQHRRLREDSAATLRQYKVRPPDQSLLFSDLSGGNQQKAVLAKWIRTGPALLLLDEPTQGVDVGSREEVNALIRDSANSGAAVICASSDFEELVDICHRVLVFQQGRVTGELSGGDISKERLAAACLEMSSAPSSGKESAKK